MQQSPTLSNPHGDVATEDKMVFERNTIPRQYMDLVHEKFAKQKQKVKENVTKLRTHIRNTSIESEEGQLEVFQANKAMKAEMEYYKTLHKRQENSMNLAREYMAAESIVEKEIFEDAMRLEIEAMTMMKQQQKHDAHQSLETTYDNKSNTTTTTPTTTTTTTTTMKKKKNKSKSLFQKARSQLTLTHLERSHVTLKKQQRETRQEYKTSTKTSQ
mmetsp:Transcript_48750/g.55229  ORF Transcript_48750/g.55229 Transcript_48750/m.55229 type:complete len:215 (+) Transcript_48750:131-775(+)